MRASTLMLVAVLLYLVHRWASNQKTVDAKTVVGALFAILVIAMLDQGETEPVAKGFAWLFLVVAAYAAIPDIGRVTGKGATGPSPKKGGKA